MSDPEFDAKPESPDEWDAPATVAEPADLAPAAPEPQFARAVEALDHPSPVKLATNKVLWIFAIGQLGWSMLSGIISNWLVYFYQPSADVLAGGHQLFITQGYVVLGFLTLIGLITATGRIFDAVTDPFIANLSDRCRHPLGRRMPFLRYAAIPFGVLTVLIFISPVQGQDMANNIWLFATVILFYLAMTCYCTPYNALIPELGRTQKLRINVSTFISTTYFFGTAFAYLVPNIAGAFQASLGYTNAFRMTIGILAVFAIICMLVPSFAIREHEYAVTQPSQTGAFRSLLKTFANRQFRTFVCSDVLYWIALTMFQTGLPFYITVLMGLDEGMTFPLFALMTLISFACYAPVNFLAKRLGKKKMVVFAFMFFAAAFAITSFVGTMGVPGVAWGVLVAVLAAIPMAILGILPQAVVADIAEADAATTGEARQGMFYAARTFAFKLGQAVSMAMFTSIALIGGNPAAEAAVEAGAQTTAPLGLRITALVAAVFCLAGGCVFMRYREDEVFAVIGEPEGAEPAGDEAAGAALAGAEPAGELPEGEALMDAAALDGEPAGAAVADAEPAGAAVADAEPAGAEPAPEPDGE